MAASASLLSLATAVPAHRLVQTEVSAAARRVLGGKFEDFEKVAQVFQTTGVETRFAVQPFEWYLEPRGWPERTAAYLAGACDLYVEAARRALDAAGLTGADVDLVVTASSTGIAVPSLEARLMGRLGLRSDTARVPLFGLGCAAGVSGLALAARLAEANPGRTVLFVTVEICTLAVRPDKLTAANVVATALFADGAAAAVLRTGGVGIATVAGGAEHTWPDTLDIMGWDIDPEGFGVVLNRAIPPFAQARLGDALVGMRARIGAAAENVGRYVCHPGGPKIVVALEEVLHLPQGSLDHEREVLRTCGNMSAPTVLFVLERVIAQELPDRVLMIAMGPGFTAASLALERRT